MIAPLVGGLVASVVLYAVLATLISPIVGIIAVLLFGLGATMFLVGWIVLAAR